MEQPWQNRIFTFNHPLAAGLLLPLGFLVVMLVAGLIKEFNFFGVILLLFNLALVVFILYFGFLRWFKFTKEQLEWHNPKLRHVLGGQEIKRYGVVKYRAFKFVYVTRKDSMPFDQDRPNISPTEDTFVIQYRKNVWLTLSKWLKSQGAQVLREDIQIR